MWSVLIALSGCEEPSWPKSSGHIGQTDICFTVQHSEYNLIVTPVAHARPVRRELTPWPQHWSWFTSTTVDIGEVLLATPTPGESLRPLGQRVVVQFAGPATSFSQTTSIGIHLIDGEWVVSTNPVEQFTLGDAGWRRELAEYSWATETYADQAALKAAFQAAGARADCARVDWVAATREANTPVLAGPRGPHPASDATE
jgi:hypothetical protein